MSKEARSWANKQRIDDRTLKLVLGALAWAADKGTGECRKSQAVIAAEAGMKERAVRYSLVVLERLEIITRKPRSKGKYGRTTDLIVLSLDRNFDVSRAAVQAIRKALKQSLQPAPRAASMKSCNRHRVPLQPAPRAGEYNPVYPEETYQEGAISKVSGISSTSGSLSPDRSPLRPNVIALPSRGVA
jgi:predicted transcriptional regulator